MGWRLPRINFIYYSKSRKREQKLFDEELLFLLREAEVRCTLMRSKIKIKVWVFLHKLMYRIDVIGGHFTFYVRFRFWCRKMRMEARAAEICSLAEDIDFFMNLEKTKSTSGVPGVL